MSTAYLFPSTLKGLADVSVSPGAGQSGYPLTWNNTTGKWEASLLPYSSISNSPIISYPGANGLSIGSIAGSQIGSTANNFLAIGTGAGANNTSGVTWVAIGDNAAALDVNSSNFLAFGAGAAFSHNSQGNNWMAFGTYAALLNLSGNNFFAVGSGAGANNTTGSLWFSLGTGSAQINKTGGNFLVLGNYANFNDGTALDSAGSNYVCIGNYSGYYETRSDTLHIANNFAKSLIFGNFQNDCIRFGGNETITSNSATWPVATAAVHCAPSNSARASLKIDPGVAPTAPNTGDFWIANGKLFIKGVTEIVFV